MAELDRIVGDSRAETGLLTCATQWGVTDLILYGLGPMLAPRSPRAGALASFAARARRRGLAPIAPVAGQDRVSAIRRFEEAHPEARFEGWVTELEYWHDCEERETGIRPCFARMDSLLTAMNAAAATRTERPWIGAYLGYPTLAEARSIARRSDRVLLNYPGQSPSHASARRLAARQSADRRLARFRGLRAEVWPILYSRGELHMSPWLRERAARGIAAATSDAERTLTEAAGGRPRGFAGFAWFDYQGLLTLGAACDAPG